MFSFYIVISSLLALAFVLLGLLVASRNINSTLNRLFLLFSTSMAGWLITNYIAGDLNFGEGLALAANRLVFFFGMFVMISLLFFMKNLIGRQTTAVWSALLGINLLFAFLGLGTSTIVNGVAKQQDTYAINFGGLSSAYFLIFLIDIGILLFISFAGRRRSHGLLRLQINIILKSLAIFLGAVFVTNAVIPFTFHYFGLANFGALLSTVLVYGVATSIAKHKLFDIRSFAVRSLAYLLTFSIIALIYVLPTVILTTYILNAPIERSTFVLLTALTLLAALLFQPLRTKFNKATNRIFFRDYYDPQAVLDRLGALLVGTVDLKKIEQGSSQILTDNLKPASIEYLLIAEQKEADEQLLEMLLKQKEDVVVYDLLSPSRQSALHEELGSRNMAVAVRLKTTHGELGYLALGFKQSGSIYSDADIRLIKIVADEIAVGLQNALRFEEIQKFNITLQEKVDDATKELRHANKRLKELDQAKDEFISMASHQLRTPLTTIKGYLSMVLEGDVGPVTKNEKQMIEQAFDSAEKMVFLIADLLNISRLQSGKFVIENKPTDLAKMIEAEVSQLQETAKNHHLTITYKKPAKFPMLNLDDTKIRQVVMNFMDNAIFYTPAGGTIGVALEATNEAVNYTVTDTGLGVPKADQHHLFTKFYRAGNARKMRPDGTGLGLFMAKKVVVAQGGAIIFKSEEGKGSTFGFSFPRSKVEIKSSPK